MRAGYVIDNLSEEMSTEEISDAFDEILGAWYTLKTACENRLVELGYDEDEYEDGTDEEIDKVLEVWDTLENVPF